jgi:osmotically-inducible protein OsmY
MQHDKTTFESRLMSAISDNPYLAGRQVRLETEQGRVVLKGVVNSYFQKQMAQESLRRVEGVNEIEIENELTVMWS